MSGGQVAKARQGLAVLKQRHMFPLDLPADVCQGKLSVRQLAAQVLVVLASLNKLFEVRPRHFQRLLAQGLHAGQLLELDAILAVTLGGTALTGGRFTLAGTVLGALIIQTLTSMIYSLGVPPEVNLVVKALLVFAVMLLQSAEFRSLFIRIARGGAPGARP